MQLNHVKMLLLLMDMDVRGTMTVDCICFATACAQAC